MSDMNTATERVEQDRAELAATLDALSTTVAPQHIASEFSDAANKIGGELAQKAWSSVRENPAGGILTVVGLALMASGPTRKPLPTFDPAPTAVDPDEALMGFDVRVAQADAELKAKAAPAPQASALRAGLQNGLDKLPPKARKRVVKAREMALSAQETVERRARRAARKTRGFAHEQPLAVGALALGFGLLAGTLLPGTRREDEILGSRRDALMDDARAVLEDEMHKVKASADAAVSGAAEGVASVRHS